MREAGTKAATLVAAVAVVAAAACGGGGTGRLTKTQYEQKLKAEGSRLRSDLSGLDLTSAGTNVKALGPKLKAAQEDVDRAATNIDKLNPPRDAAADNNKIADSLHKFARVFGQMKEAAAKGDQAKLASLVVRLRSAAEEGSQAAQDLKRKGYAIGQLTG